MNTAKLFILLLLYLLMNGCVERVHKQFNYNRYIYNYNIHVTNDSLQLYLKSPADFDYLTNKRKLEKVIRRHHLYSARNVLLYGKTNLDPFYEYFILLGKPAELSRRIAKRDNIIVLDTIMQQQAIKLIGINLDEDQQSYKEDMANIFSSIRFGPDYRKEVATVLDVVSEYNGSALFLEAYHQINNFPAYDGQEEDLKLQMQLTYASFLSNFDEYDSLHDKFFTSSRTDSLTGLIRQHLLLGEAALSQLDEQLDKARLVVFNENHFVPAHRAFVLTQLPRLKQRGFTHLALEALGEDQDSILNLPGAYPKLSTGFYTREQYFADLIRTAKQLGFTFVAYENTDPLKDREAGQADNLYQKTFARDSAAKVVALVGVDHLLEVPTLQAKKWMASLIKDRYGINPLTISQTHLYTYRDLSKGTFGLVKGDVFKDHRLASVDFHLLNDVSSVKLMQKGTGLSYKNEHEFAIQVSIYLPKELKEATAYQETVPFRSIYLKPKQETDIPLPEGNYWLYTFNDRGEQIDFTEITPANIKQTDN